LLGGQLAVSLTGAGGYNRTSIDGTLTTFSATRTGSISDSRWGFADVYPQASLRWNTGVNNFMVYMMGDVPVGTYDPLAWPISASATAPSTVELDIRILTQRLATNFQS
jgi:hypothetical protein